MFLIGTMSARDFFSVTDMDKYVAFDLSAELSRRGKQVEFGATLALAWTECRYHAIVQGRDYLVKRWFAIQFGSRFLRLKYALEDAITIDMIGEAADYAIDYGEWSGHAHATMLERQCASLIKSYGFTYDEFLKEVKRRNLDRWAFNHGL